MEVDGNEYNWTIIIPPSAQMGDPGILFLHGIGQSGDDGELHIKHGLPAVVRDNPDAWPFVLIVPQKESYSDWDFHESAVMDMLDLAIEEEYVDPEHIGITGLSQGGHGTLIFASNHPDRFDAAAPVCGYAHIAFDEDGQSTPRPSMGEYQSLMTKIAKNIGDTPVWLFHGEDDTVVPVITSRMMNLVLKSNDADVQYTEFPGVEHDAWDPAYEMEELADWFKEHLLD